MRILQTRDTMSDIYLAAVKIRNQVFVKEQNVPLSVEIDENEAYAVHFVLYDDKKVPLATVRLLPINDEIVKVQRMAVLKEYRGKGLGKILLKGAEDFAREHDFKEIILGAQWQVRDFYHKLGFIPQGEPFYEAGIKHITMTKKLAE